MIYHFLSSLGNQGSPEKITIIHDIINEHYKELLNNDTILIITSRINALYSNELLSIEKIIKKHINSKIVLCLVDIENINYVTNFVKPLIYVDEIWAAEFEIVQWGIDNSINIKHFLLPDTKTLKKIKNSETPDIDVLFYGSINLYNIQIIKSLIESNLTFFHTDNFTVLNEHLGSAKIVLCLNVYGEQYQDQIKLRYLLSNDKFVVTNKSKFNNFTDVIETSNEELLSTIQDILKNDLWKKNIKNNLQNN